MGWQRGGGERELPSKRSSYKDKLIHLYVFKKCKINAEEIGHVAIAAKNVTYYNQLQTF